MAAKPIYGAGLDAGSRRTRLVICALEKGRVRFVGCASCESQGWFRGRIADQRAVADTILRVLHEVEANAGVSVDSVVVGMGGPAARGASGHGLVELGHLREIEQRDVNRVVVLASRVQLPAERMVLQLFPQDFVVDGHPGHRDPRKMLASRLEANVHLVTVLLQEHHSLVGAVNQAHLVVEETVFEALAACYAAVLPEDRREGIALVDIGKESTEMVVYYGDAMRLASTVRVCGDHFTRDLARKLILSFEEAELVKMEYGRAVSTGCSPNVLVELPAAEDRQPREERWKVVSWVLEARAVQLFEHVRSEFARVGMERALVGGVFLTGGGARLPDLCDVAERVLGCQARYGLVVGMRDWPEDMNDREWTTAAGLAMYSAKLKAITEHQRETAGWLGKILK